MAQMNKRASIYSVNNGLVVTVHANGYVWTKHYDSDIQGIVDLGALGVLETTNPDALGVDYPLPDDFDADSLADAGFVRKYAAVQ